MTASAALQKGKDMKLTQPRHPSPRDERWSHPVLRALVECIRDARSPRHDEVDALSDLVWREALARRTDANRGDARIVARAALCGSGGGRE